MSKLSKKVLEDYKLEVTMAEVIEALGDHPDILLGIPADAEISIVMPTLEHRYILNKSVKLTIEWKRIQE